MNPAPVGLGLMEAGARRDSRSKYFSSHLDIFWKSQRFLDSQNVRYAYGSLLRTLYRIQKIPSANHPIPYVKTQNIVKLKKPVISTPLGYIPIVLMGGAMPSLLSTTGRLQRTGQ